MANLTIVAHITAEAEHVAFIQAELQQLVAPTLAEPGCLQYDLHIDNNNPAHFMFYETWTSRDHWQAHMNSRHLKHFAQVSEGKLAAFILHEMTFCKIS